MCQCDDSSASFEIIKRQSTRGMMQLQNQLKAYSVDECKLNLSNVVRVLCYVEMCLQQKEQFKSVLVHVLDRSSRSLKSATSAIQPSSCDVVTCKVVNSL